MQANMDIGKLTDRQRELKVWLLVNGITQKTLAQELGISPQLLSMTLSGRRMTRERFAALTALGIPAELLPSPVQGSDRAGRAGQDE